jgi:hypothetical protein
VTWLVSPPDQPAPSSSAGPARRGALIVARSSIAMPPPAPDLMLLERANPHPRDARIVFDEPTHKYYIDGDKMFTISVSGLLHDYFPHFDASEVVNQYYKSWSENKQSKYFSLIRYLRHVVGIENDDDIKAEIAASWNAAGNAASGAGTKTHLDIELHLNDDARCDTTNTDLAQFHAWRATPPYNTWKPYRTEWSVYDEKACVAGQIDSLWVELIRKEEEEEEVFHMVDWKRSKLIETKTSFGETGKKPFDKLPNTNHGHYTVQQNCYAHMLRKHYGIECATLSLVQIHPDLPTFKVWPLQIMKEETAEIFKRRFMSVRDGEIVGFVSASAAGVPRILTDEEEAARAEERARDMRMLSCLLARAASLEEKWADEPASAKRARDA